MDPLLLQGTVKSYHYFFVDTADVYPGVVRKNDFLPTVNRSRGKLII